VDRASNSAGDGRDDATSEQAMTPWERDGRSEAAGPAGEQSHGEQSHGEQSHLEGDDAPGVLGSLIAFPAARSPNYFVQHFRVAAHVPSPRPGAMVAVAATTADGRQSLILARVANVWEENPHEDAMSSNLRDVLPIRTEYAPEGSSTVIYRVAEMEPLEEALLDENGAVARIGDVQTLPRAGALALQATDDLVTGALGLEPDPVRGIYAGHVRGNPALPVVLNRGAIQRHIFIAGGVGTGKSYTRGVIAEELAALGVPQVNLDVNGEMLEAARELGGVNLLPGDGFTLPLSAFTADDVLNAVPSLNGNMVELVRHAHEELLKESRRTGKHFLVADLVKKIEAVGPTLDMKLVTITPAKSRTESLRRIPYLGDPYDWKRALTPGAFINIDCRGMLVSDLRIIAAAVARDIQGLAQARQIPFVVLSIDEFHLVAPAHEDTVALQVLRELARIGRHLRIGLILTTQSPQDVDRSILKRLLTRFLHAIEPDQLDALRGVFSDASDDLVKQLPKLPQGVCILTGAYETIRHATVLEVRKRATTHGGGTPDIWSDLERAGWVGKRSVIQERGRG
jgi:DNA helicase HerA-like ATPase